MAYKLKYPYEIWLVCPEIQSATEMSKTLNISVNVTSIKYLVDRTFRYLIYIEFILQTIQAINIRLNNDFIWSIIKKELFILLTRKFGIYSFIT